MVDWVPNQYRRLHHNNIYSEIGNRFRIKRILPFWFFPKYNYFSHAIWETAHTEISSLLNLDILYAQCYNCIIGKWRKYQYSHCAYLKRLIYFQWHIYIFIIYQSAILVIYTPYLSLTIWHDLLTSSLLLCFTQFPALKSE